MLEALMAWGFYGRGGELAALRAILQRGRGFFAPITGRRQIGKTTLIQHALEAAGADRILYVQIPDSAPAGVLSAVADSMDTFEIAAEQFPRPTSLRGLAALIGDLARAGFIVVLDEFRYFSRFGTCKRSATKLVSDLPSLDGHIERFLAMYPRYRSWSVERVAIAPLIDDATRAAIRNRGVIAQDLSDLMADLG